MRQMARPQRQLPLFDPASFNYAEPSALEAMVWSYSRRSVLRRCAYQYYLNYYASSLRAATSENDKDELRFLKELSNRYERAGEILHLVIASSLREAQRGTHIDVERSIAWARRLFSADRAFSQRFPDGGEPASDTRFPPVRLREYHYRQADADRLLDEAEERLIAALRTFATGLAYGTVRHEGSAAGALVEHPFKIRLDYPSGRVEGKIDLAFERQGLVTIVDWKLGELDGIGDDSLQLAVYSLWASLHFGCDPSDQRICKAFLGSGTLIDYSVTADLLAATRARIAQDMAVMATMHPYGIAGRAEAFTPCAQPAVCGNCPFQRVCDVGKAFLNA